MTLRLGVLDDVLLRSDLGVPTLPINRRMQVFL